MKKAKKIAHAALGASSADRWMNCPGSVALGEGLPDTESVYAQQGTLAHHFAAQKLLTGKYPEAELPHGEELPEDFFSAIELYVDVVNRATEKCDVYWIEEQATLQALNPPTDMFGTPDFIAFYKKQRLLDVTDFKFGQGHAVDAWDNPQLLYYAVLALIRVKELMPDALIDTVAMTIVQPRAPHPDGAIRTATISVMELTNWIGDLMAAADRTLVADAPRVPGPWCRWCKAVGRCPEKAQAAINVAQNDFADNFPDVEPVTVATIGTLKPRAPGMMTVEDLSRVLAAADLLEDWIKDVRNYAHGRLEAGEPVPGFKLVAKRAQRRWRDEGEARKWGEGMGLKKSEVITVSVLSPNQMEKALGRGAKVPEALVVKQSSGNVVAPEHDDRPAVAAITAGQDFAVDILNALME